jgi:hypothetical protein
MGWNYRLFKDTIKDKNGTEVERLCFREIWYDDKSKPNGMSMEPVFDDEGKALPSDTPKDISFEQFGEDREQEGTYDFSKVTYDPIDVEMAKIAIHFTLTKLMEALDKPILTDADFR